MTPFPFLINGGKICLEVSIMRMGVRKPSIKRSVKSRTTGRITRAAKKSVNPMYGKKGTGLATNPKRSVYNKAYHKRSIGIFDILGKLFK